MLGTTNTNYLKKYDGMYHIGDAKSFIISQEEPPPPNTRENENFLSLTMFHNK